MRQWLCVRAVVAVADCMCCVYGCVCVFGYVCVCTRQKLWQAGCVFDSMNVLAVAVSVWLCFRGSGCGRVCVLCDNIMDVVVVVHVPLCTR